MLKEKKFTIEQVAELTGLPASSLRNWEKRYHFLSPDRLENGYRLYGLEQVFALQKISRRIHAGFKIGELADLMEKGQELPKLPGLEVSSEVKKYLLQMQEALLEFKQEEAEGIWRNLASMFIPVQMVEMVLAPMLADLNGKLKSKSISIVQQRFSAAFIKHRLSTYITLLKGGLSQPKKAVLFTLEGDWHEGALLLTGSLLQIQGWQVFYLGPSLPFSEVVPVIQKIRPAVAIVSCCCPDVLLKNLKNGMSLDIPICVSGVNCTELPEGVELPAHIKLLDDNVTVALDELTAVASN